MKAKPDIRQFAAPKDPTAFLEGALADRSDRTEADPATSTAPAAPPASQAAAPKPSARAPRSRAPAPPPAMPVALVQKLFRLRWDTANALRMGAAELSTQTGKRITETEIVESLLREHFKLDS